MASLAQLAEHALRKRTVVGSIPTGGLFHQRPPALTTQTWRPLLRARLMDTRSLQRMSRRDSRRFQDQHDSASEWLRRWTRNPLGSARRGFESPRCRYSSHFLTRDVKDCPCASYLVCFVCGGGNKWVGGCVSGGVADCIIFVHSHGGQTIGFKTLAAPATAGPKINMTVCPSG